MLKVGQIIRKEFIQLRRDPRMAFIVIMAPIIQLLVLGYAANLDVRDIPIIFCDLDSSAASRAFISQFPHSGYFKTAGVIDRLEDVDAHIDGGKASLAVVVPKGMGKMMARRDQVPVQIIVDGAESQSAAIALSYATMIATRYSRQVLIKRLER